ncbi:MAG: COG1361 S-layer family protein [Candidatus Nanoarchaeia archaeon]
MSNKLTKNKLTSNLIFVFMTIIFMSISVVAIEYSDSSSSVISLTLVNQDPAPAIAGNVVDVRIGVENMGGGSVENLVLELEPSYPFELLSGEEYTQTIGTLNNYQSGDNMIIVKFKIKVNKDTTAGSYDLKLTYYTQGQKETTSITRTLNIDVSGKESAEIMQIDKTSLVPGKQSNLKFTITNVGSSPLRDLVFSWENEDGIILPVGSDNTKYIKYLEIEDSVDVEYEVIADSEADAGLYTLNLQLKYSDTTTDDESIINTLAGMYVGGGTDFEIAFSETSGTQTSFTIANTGSNPAYSVSVIVPSQKKWSVNGANSMIIGNLNKGDYTVASFNLGSTQAAPSFQQGQTPSINSTSQTPSRENTASNTITLQVAYTDTMGNRLISEKKVIMSQTSSGMNVTTSGLGSNSIPGMYGHPGVQQKSFFSKYKWYFASVLVLFIAFLVFRHYKKKKIIEETKNKKVLKQ